MTLSFYVKSNKTGTYAVNLEQDDASRVIGSTYAISSADTWEFKTITVGGDTSGTINDDNGAGLVVSWYLLAGSNYTATDNTSYSASADGKQAYGHSTTWGQATNDNFFITGVQLELGEQDTPFEHRSFADDLARCQRYAYMIGDPVNSGQTDIVNNGIVIGTANGFIAIPFPCTMRAEPSLTVNNATYFRLHSTSGGSKAVTGVAIESGETTERMALINATSSGLTAGQGTLMITSDSSSNGGTILFSAEL